MATTAEIVTGTDNTKAITPAGLNAATGLIGLGNPGAGTIITLVRPLLLVTCDGSAVDRVSYADLFTVCGTTYGSGDWYNNL